MSYELQSCDVNVRRIVQHVGTKAPELALWHDTTIFLKKQIVEAFESSTIKNRDIAHPYVQGVDSDGEDESVAHGWALIASARPHQEATLSAFAGTGTATQAHYSCPS